MLFKLSKRPEPSRQMVLVSPLLALALTLVFGVFLFLIMGVSPSEALYAFFVEPLTTTYGWAELAVKATPLVLIAVTLSIGFRAGVWNIGAEGQLRLSLGNPVDGDRWYPWRHALGSHSSLPAHSL